MFAKRIATKPRQLQHFVDFIDEALTTPVFRTNFRLLLSTTKARGHRSPTLVEPVDREPRPGYQRYVEDSAISFLLPSTQTST
jgi:hypothetical protein